MHSSVLLLLLTLPGFQFLFKENLDCIGGGWKENMACVQLDKVILAHQCCIQILDTS